MSEWTDDGSIGAGDGGGLGAAGPSLGGEEFHQQFDEPL
jgi:hypothetical protein